MKKLLSMLLVVVLLLALCPSVLAAHEVMRTAQKLTVNGSYISCDIYNIDGSNYFKLRDLAALMNGTRSQFAVGYDEATRTVSITLGEPYTEIGGELQIAEDKSGSAVPSAQTILINGTPRSDLSVFNIGGNNFFKLRDLGAAVGFEVDYDEATKTMIVESYAIPKNLVRVSWGDQYGNRGEETYTYDSKGNLLKKQTSENGIVTYTTTFTCDSQGRVTGSASSDGKHTSSTVYAADGSCTQTSHDVDDYGTSDWKWTENAAGIIISEEYTVTYPDGSSEHGSNTYTASGLQLTSVSQYYEGSRLTDEYSTTLTYDSKGRVTSREEIGDVNDGINTRSLTFYNTDGEIVTEEYRYLEPNGDYTSGRTVNEFNAAGKIARSTVTNEGLYTDEDGEPYTYSNIETTSYTYDAKGYLVSTEQCGDSWVTRTVYTNDAKGNCISEKTTDYYLFADSEIEDGYNLTTYTYDAAGNMLTMVSTNDYGSSYSATYRYDSSNRLISEAYSSGDSDWSDYFEYTYEYDNYGNQIQWACYSCSEYYDEETGETVSTESSSVERVEYDARGNILRTVSKYVEDGYTDYNESVYTFDIDGNLVKYIDIDNDVIVTYIYEYGA